MEEFRVSILKMEKKVQDTHHNEPPFVTEVKENYQSPYKASSSPQAKTLERINKEHRLLTRTQEYFFTNKYNMSQSSPMKPNHQLLNCLKSNS